MDVRSWVARVLRKVADFVALPGGSPEVVETTSQEGKKLKRSEACLRVLAMLHLAHNPRTLRHRMRRQIKIPSPRGHSEEERRTRLLVVYEDLLRDIHNNSRMSWTIGTIFITASFAIFGVTLSFWQDLPSVYWIVWSAAVVSVSLVWSWHSLSTYLADLGHKKFLIRNYVESVLDLPRYEPGHPSRRGRYRFAPIPVIIHLLWLGITSHAFTLTLSWESLSWLFLCLYLVVFIFFILRNYWVSVVEYDEGEAIKSKWMKE